MFTFDLMDSIFYLCLSIMPTMALMAMSMTAITMMTERPTDGMGRIRAHKGIRTDATSLMNGAPKGRSVGGCEAEY